MCAPSKLEGAHVARYVLNIHDGAEILDDTRLEFGSMAEVPTQALRACGDILREREELVFDGGRWKMDVVNESGETVLIFSFSVEEPTSGDD